MSLASDVAPPNQRIIPIDPGRVTSAGNRPDKSTPLNRGAFASQRTPGAGGCRKLTNRDKKPEPGGECHVGNPGWSEAEPGGRGGYYPVSGLILEGEVTEVGCETGELYF